MIYRDTHREIEREKGAGGREDIALGYFALQCR